MWLTLAFLSAILLGSYDVAKKVALRSSSVLILLLVTTLVCSLIFLPLILLSAFAPKVMEGTIFYTPLPSLQEHGLLVVKSLIVLSAWYLGYLGLKHLPLSLVGPINATRPVMVLVGAMLIFGERLNLYQWIGVALALISLLLLSRSGRKEGISFVGNRWVLCVFAAALLGAISGLYDRYLLRSLPPMMVQSWYSLYQVFVLCPLVGYLHLRGGDSAKRFRLSWAMVLVPILLSMADIAYFFALAQEESMISVVSMIRRSGVVVSFLGAMFVLGEGNLRAKAWDMLLILVGMVFLFLGSRG